MFCLYAQPSTCKCFLQLQWWTFKVTGVLKSVSSHLQWKNELPSPFWWVLLWVQDKKPSFKCPKSFGTKANSDRSGGSCGILLGSTLTLLESSTLISNFGKCHPNSQSSFPKSHLTWGCNCGSHLHRETLSGRLRHSPCTGAFRSSIRSSDHAGLLTFGALSCLSSICHKGFGQGTELMANLCHPQARGICC